MLKLSLGIFLIISLFKPSIQQYSDAYCKKYIATFPFAIELCNNSSNTNNKSSILYKIIKSLQNNNCSVPEKFILENYSPNVCKNNMILSYDYPIIPDILPKTIAKKENWNEYIVLSGSNFASNEKRNIVKSIKNPKKVLNEEIVKYIDFPKLVLSEILISFSAFLFTFTFFILFVN
jgi:hypothetical protein